VLEKTPKTTDDSSGQGTPKSGKNKGATASKSETSDHSNSPSKVPADDNTNTMNARCFGKQTNKLSDKPTMDVDLKLVVEAWPRLPSAIRSAIVAIVRASKEQ
jgi:hypothetical protein